MTDDQVLVWLREEYAKPFAGWDFSYLDGRRHTIGVKPWDLETIVLERLSTATSVLDVDTGDGRLFAEFLGKSGFRGRTAATEGYPPNVPLARATLEPLRVEVREATGEALPWTDGSFDLILNRHGLLNGAESWRALNPGGWLVTQQVGSRTNLDIHRMLGAPLPDGPDWSLATARTALEQAGFQIHRAQEDFPITRYDDVGALVWYLKAIPWQIPDFTVDRYADRLVALHRQVERTGTPMDVGFHLFLLVAQRPEVTTSDARRRALQQLEGLDGLELDRPDILAEAWRTDRSD